MHSTPLTSRADIWGRHAAALLGVSIPISVWLDNVLLLLVAILWLAGGNLRRKLAAIAANPVALAALALFGALAAALTYGTRNPGDGLGYLGKYVDLLFIPIFVTLFQQARHRDVALRWFSAGMILTFVVAEMISLGLLDGNAWLPRPAGYNGAFKSSITHGLLAAYAAFLFALLAKEEEHWPRRAMFAVLAVMAVKNVVLVAISRTGYLVLALLAVYFFFTMFHRRGRIVACLLLAALFGTVYGMSESFRERVNTVAVETANPDTRWPSRESVLIREAWYKLSFDIVLRHPLLGSGTGSFPRVYEEAAGDSKAVRTPNPHNEYLLITVQTGLVGLALLLHLFWRQVAAARQLASPLETRLAYGLVITIAVGCLFNSFLLDHTEGLFYAWFTGMLFAGLERKPSPGPDDAGTRPG